MKACKTKVCRVCSREFVAVGNRTTCSEKCAEAQAKETKRRYNAAHPNRTKPGYRPPKKRGDDIESSLRAKVIAWMELPDEERWRAKAKWPKKHAQKMDAIAKKLYIARNNLFRCVNLV